MFLKQYNYKPRTNSQSSGTDNSAVTDSATSNNANSPSSPTDKSPISAAVAGRRRSSATEKFAGLHGVKRNSQDQSSADRKASFADQSTNQPGILGGMWQNFTKGTK